MPWYYIICITKKPYHADPYTSIQSYGVSTDVGATHASERWTQDEMIAVLESQEHVVKSGGTNPKTGVFEYAELEVVRRADGSKYVKSKNDGDRPDNLLSQRECKAGDAS